MSDSTKTSLKCPCGQPVRQRDVMQQGIYTHPTRGDSVYIKSRCSRCKKPSEHFVKMDEWNDSLLVDDAPGASGR